MDPQSPVTQDDLLSATTPETLAALMARGDDAAIQGVTAPAPAPVATAAVDSAAAAPAPAPAADGAAPGTEGSESQAGVATKSGKGVLPYRVLADERTAKQHWRDQAQSLEQQLATAQAHIQALQKSGGTQQDIQGVLDSFTDEEIDRADEDIPLLAKVARALKSGALTAPAASPAPAPVAAVDPQDAADEQAAAVHAAMAATPLLSRLQQRGGAVWATAVGLDEKLQGDPAWASKPLAERFAEVQRQIADELGIEVPVQATTTTPAPAPAQAPAPARAQVQPFQPNTLSDLTGATPVGEGGINERADGMAMARQFAHMSDAQMAAAIRRSVS